MALSGSPERVASRTADAVPSPEGAVPFFLDMFDNVITFLLALDCHFDQGGRLSHVGTEGPWSSSASTVQPHRMAGHRVMMSEIRTQKDCT